MRPFIIALLFLAVLPAVVIADDDRHAKRLRQAINQLIADQSALFKQMGGTLATDGPVLIEPAGPYYAVTLPEITLIHPNRFQTNLGLIALNASPAGEKSWNITTALPTPIVTQDDQGRPQSKITLGRQFFSGLWHEEQRHFTALKTQYQDVRFSFVEKSPAFAFSAASIEQFAYGFTLNNMAAEKTDLALRFGINGLAIEGSLPAFARLLPEEIVVNVDINELPIERAYKVQQDFLMPHQFAASPLWILDLLKEQGSQSRINRISLKNTHFSVHLSGHLTPAAQTPFGQAGELTLDITNIDQLLLALNEGAAQLPAGQQGKMQAVRVALTLMSALGDTVGEEGAALKRYKITLRDDSKVIINGTDFSALLNTIPKTKDTKADR